MAVKNITTGPGTTSSVLTVPQSETYFDRIMREMNQNIAEHAYYLAQQRGFNPGNDLDDWFRAESELFRAVPVELTHDDDELKVLAEVPGFTADDVNIHLEPTRLVIRGNKKSEQHTKKGTLSYTERESTQIFRAVHLPVEVDPEKANATVRDGLLEITLPKAQSARPKRVQVKAA
jgi:HSP20 family protein